MNNLKMSSVRLAQSPPEGNDVQKLFQQRQIEARHIGYLKDRANPSKMRLFPAEKRKTGKEHSKNR